jgi:hypothetical protein
VRWRRRAESVGTGGQPAAPQRFRERPVYFWHIPKTAGLSVHRFLEQRFPPEVVCQELLWDGLVGLPVWKAVSYGVYRGHFLGYLDAFLAKPTLKLTLLREPTARTISHFLHVRRDGNHPLHEIVAAQSLRDFVTAPPTRHMAANFQARYLALAGDVWPAARKFTVEERKAFKLQHHLETLPLPEPGVLYDRARSTLDGFAFVGTSDRFDDAMRQLAEVLNVPTHVPFAPQNVAPPSQVLTLDPETASAIAAATEVDRELYRLAQEWPGSRS